MGGKDGKHINSEASALFRAEVEDVLPLASKDRHDTHAATSAAARARRRARRAARQEPPHPKNAPDRPVDRSEKLLFRRPGVTGRMMKNLSSGKIRCQEEIDLHGLTEAQARAELTEFINAACLTGLRCVRVVHGKGLSSGSRGPVLKTAVNSWLPGWDAVLAFCSARPIDGGTGAVYVLLDRTR